MEVKKVKNVRSFKKKLHTNLIAEQKETGNFEWLSFKQFLNSFEYLLNIKSAK